MTDEIKTIRSSRGLTEILFEELDLLRNGNSTPQQARAKASIAKTIVAVSKLEIEHARFVSNAREDSENLMHEVKMG